MSSSDIPIVLKILKRHFPNPGGMEIGGHPYRTVVAVALSARTRDEQVLKLLPGFFAAFPSSKELAAATTRQIEAKIDTIGMYRQKARNLKAMGEMLEERGGNVPSTMDELVKLPGVGRKTASVVLVSCFGVPAIAVDTHVLRVTNRLGWIRARTPEPAERALLALVPRRIMRLVNQVFVKFGRYVCVPGRPRCWACPIKDFCAYQNKNLVPPKDADAVLADIDRREAELERLRKAI